MTFSFSKNIVSKISMRNEIQGEKTISFPVEIQFKDLNSLSETSIQKLIELGIEAYFNQFILAEKNNIIKTKREKFLKSEIENKELTVKDLENWKKEFQFADFQNYLENGQIGKFQYSDAQFQFDTDMLNKARIRLFSAFDIVITKLQIGATNYNSCILELFRESEKLNSGELKAIRSIINYKEIEIPEAITE